MSKISLCVTVVLLFLLSSVCSCRINCEIKVFRVLDCVGNTNRHDCQEYTPNHVEEQDASRIVLGKFGVVNRPINVYAFPNLQTVLIKTFNGEFDDICEYILSSRNTSVNGSPCVSILFGLLYAPIVGK